MARLRNSLSGVVVNIDDAKVARLAPLSWEPAEEQKKTTRRKKSEDTSSNDD